MEEKNIPTHEYRITAIIFIEQGGGGGAARGGTGQRRHKATHFITKSVEDTCDIRALQHKHQG